MRGTGMRDSLFFFSKAARLALSCLWSNLSSKFEVALQVVFALVAYFVEYRSHASCAWNMTSDFRCSNNKTVEVSSGALVLVVLHFVLLPLDFGIFPVFLVPSFAPL